MRERFLWYIFLISILVWGVYIIIDWCAEDILMKIESESLNAFQDPVPAHTHTHTLVHVVNRGHQKIGKVNEDIALK